MHLSLVITLCLSFTSLSVQRENAAPSLKDLLAKQANLTSFSDFLKNSLPDVLSELEAQEKSGQPITILAPSNAAFDKIPYYSVIGPAWAAGNVDVQREIIKYHILPGDITTKVLLPTFQYFPSWLTNTALANVTSGQRVGAVMQGGKLLFFVSGESNRSPSTIHDLEFAGGFVTSPHHPPMPCVFYELNHFLKSTVHVIDSLLIPPQSFAITSAKFNTASEPTRVNSFLGAAYMNKNASLISLINTSKDITIFAPNNAAMKKVSGALTSMSEDDLDQLLSYHIVISEKNGGGPYYSTLLTNATTLKSLQGKSLTISSASNSLFVNSARILTSDLLISGGVVHVLDNVLDPDITTVSPNPSLATQAPVLSTAGGSIDLSKDIPFTSYVPDVTALAAGATGTASSAATYSGASRTGTIGSGIARQTAAVKGAAAGSRRGGCHIHAFFMGLAIAAMAWRG